MSIVGIGQEVKAGAIFIAPYPFVRDEYRDFEEDYPITVKTWKPNVRHEWCGPEDTEAVADAIGEIILTVISVHKPGRYPTRVFFTRRWRDPSGKEFGKTKCRCTTLQAFRRFARGYQYEYRVLTLSEQTERAEDAA